MLFPSHILSKFYRTPPLRPSSSSSSSPQDNDNSQTAENQGETQTARPYSSPYNLPRYAYASPSDPTIPYERPNSWSSSSASSNISIRPDSELYKNFRRQKPPKDDEIEIPGRFTIVQISDVIYNAIFDKCDRVGKSVYRIFECDIDDLKVNAEDLTIDCTVTDLDDRQRVETLYVLDQIDIDAVLETLEICNDIVDLTLSLKMVTRDFYFTGIYEGLKGVSGETLKEMNFNDLVEKIPAGGIDEMEMDSPIYDKTSVKETMKNLRREQPPKIVCVFCDMNNYDDKTLQFEIHPYVPKNFAKEPVYFCVSCKANWKKYRDDARKGQRLIYPGEKNEEICAICSDCPISDLILCSGCPKSFCDGCLRRVLTTEELEEVNDSTKEDWYCMCCNIDNMKKTSTKPSVSSSNKFAAKNRSTERSSSRDKERSGGPIRSNSPERSSGPDRSSSRGKEREKVSKNHMLPNSSIPVLNDMLLTSEPTSKKGLHVADDINEKGRGRRSSSGGKNSQSEAYSTYPTTDPISTSNVSRGHAKGTRASTGAISSSSLAARLMSEELFEPVSLKGSKKVTLESEENNSIGNRRGVSQIKKSAPKSTSKNAQELLPVNKEMSEVDYFAQYVKVFEGVCRECNIGNAPTVTEDTCFLCKDGGDLIECDHHFGKPSACRKVYHDYCMGFQGQLALDKEWMCMRHYCATCGETNPYYICRYCPISICKRCPAKGGPNFYQVQYAPVSTPSLPEHKGKHIQQIVCHQCLVMLNRAKGKKILSDADLRLLGPINGKLFAPDADVEIDFTDVYNARKRQKSDNRIPSGSFSSQGRSARGGDRRSAAYQRGGDRRSAAYQRGGRGRGGRGRSGRGRGGRVRGLNDIALFQDTDDSSVFASSNASTIHQNSNGVNFYGDDGNTSSTSSFSNVPYIESAYADEDTAIDASAIGLAVEFVDHPELPADVPPSTLGRLVSGVGGMYEVQIQNRPGTVRVSPPCLTRPGQPYLWGCMHCGKNYKRQMWLLRHLESQKKIGGPCYRPFNNTDTLNGHAVTFKSGSIANAPFNGIMKSHSTESIANGNSTPSYTYDTLSSTNGTQNRASGAFSNNANPSNSNHGSVSALKKALKTIENLKSRPVDSNTISGDANSVGDFNPFRRTCYPTGNEIEYNSAGSTSNLFRKAPRLEYQHYGSNNTANGNGYS